MFLNLHGFHVKGDSHPPSQSPMRIDSSLRIDFVYSLSRRPNRGGGFFAASLRFFYDGFVNIFSARL